MLTVMAEWLSKQIRCISPTFFHHHSGTHRNCLFAWNTDAYTSFQVVEFQSAYVKCNFHHLWIWNVVLPKWLIWPALYMKPNLNTCMSEKTWSTAGGTTRCNHFLLSKPLTTCIMKTCTKLVDCKAWINFKHFPRNNVILFRLVFYLPKLYSYFKICLLMDFLANQPTCCFRQSDNIQGMARK